jgi:hypothetical protein
MMKRMLCTVLLGSMIVTGCTPLTFGPEDKRLGVAVTEESIFFHDLEALETNLKNEVFNVKVINISDDRGPSNFADEISDRVIHEYRPEQLTMGLTPYLKAALHAKLQFNKKQETEFFAEYTLKDVRTQIVSGDFWSGKYGYFEATVNMDVIIRDETSKVLVQKSLSTTGKVPRKVAKGRHPTEQMDRKAMLDTLNLSLKKIALLSGWELRQTLNGTRDYYDPLKIQTIDTVYE